MNHSTDNSIENQQDNNNSTDDLFTDHSPPKDRHESTIYESQSNSDLIPDDNNDQNGTETISNNSSSSSYSKMNVSLKMIPTTVTELPVEDSKDCSQSQSLNPNFSYSSTFRLRNYPEFQPPECNRFNSVDSLDSSSMMADNDSQTIPSLPPLERRTQSSEPESPRLCEDRENSFSQKISILGDDQNDQPKEVKQPPMMMRVSRNPNFMPHSLRLSQTRSAANSEEVNNKEIENRHPLPQGHPLPRLMVNTNPLSPTENAYTGLQNQGATCYMNSILQALYHLPIFRSLIYQMDNSNAKSDDENIPLNLQRLFAMMQLRIRPSVPTNELTKSFGWTDRETYMQHDIQEFCRIILDNLEKKMNKQPDLKDAISTLYRGEMRSRIEGVDVDYETTKNDYFYDLSMTVKDISSLEGSFSKYIEPEIINDYETGQYGKQQIRKSIEFLQFPPVLYIHLRRFEYDPQRQDMIKINSRFAYNESIDLSQFMADDTADPDDQIFDLFGVLVHHGGTYSGHYYAYLRTMADDDTWFMFNDSSVHEVPKEKAIETNFGGIDSSNSLMTMERSYSAYMLIYIRRSKIAEFYADVSDDQIPESAKEYVYEKKIEIERQIEERRRLENMISYTLFTDSNLQFNALKYKLKLQKPAPASIIQIDKDEPISNLYRKVQQETQAKSFCLYLYQPYAYSFELLQSDSSFELHLLQSNKLFMLTNCEEVFSEEEEEEEYFEDEEKILFFFYVYFKVPSKHSIRFWSSILLSRYQRISSLYSHFNRKFHQMPECIFHYDIANDNVDRLDFNRSINDYQFRNGNVLVFQTNHKVFEYFNTKDQSFIEEIYNEEEDDNEKEYQYLQQQKNIPFDKYMFYYKDIAQFKVTYGDKVVIIKVPLRIANFKFIDFILSIFKIYKMSTLVFYDSKNNHLPIYYDDQIIRESLYYVSKIDVHVLNQSIDAKQIASLTRFVYFSGSRVLKKHVAFLNNDANVDDLIDHYVNVRKKFSTKYQLVTFDFRSRLFEKQDGYNQLADLSGRIQIVVFNEEADQIQLCITKRAIKQLNLELDKRSEFNCFFQIFEQELFADTKRRLRKEFNIEANDENIIYELAFRTERDTENFLCLSDQDIIYDHLDYYHNILIIDAEKVAQNNELSFSHNLESRNDSIVIRN